MAQDSSELKCCKKCGAIYTCNHKGECCPECHYFDPEDVLCMAVERQKKPKKVAPSREEAEEQDPETFLFEDEEEEEEPITDTPEPDDEGEDEDAVEPEDTDVEEDTNDEW